MHDPGDFAPAELSTYEAGQCGAGIANTDRLARLLA